MADEITVSGSLRCVNGNLRFLKTTIQLSFDQNAIGGPAGGMVNVGTSEETISLSELTVLGWCIIENLDDANYVEIGFSTGAYGIRIEAGEFALFRLNPGATVYAKADTAAVKIVVNALED